MMKYKLMKVVMVVLLLTITSADLFAIKVIRKRHNGDGSGQYAFVDRQEKKDSEGLIYQVDIMCENPGPQDCPKSIAFGGIGVDNQEHEAALIPHLEALLIQGLSVAETSGSFSGSGSQHIVDSQGNPGIFVYTLNVTYDSNTETWIEVWEINQTN